MRMSDAIAAYILSRLEATEQDMIELQRNELAGEIGCVPSQINYVLSSRFTPEQGYIVESRRGGGGYIRVRRIPFCSEISLCTHIVNSIGDELPFTSAKAIAENLLDRGVLSKQAASVMLAALSDRALQAVVPVARDRLRADLMKYMLTASVM